MANSSALIKTTLHKALAEGVYRDLVTRSSNYYYYLGKTLRWSDESSPPYPTDSYEYERLARSEIITMKEIKANDVAFVIPRYNWVASTIYDMYDDTYSDEVLGLDIISGGSGYSSLPTITITGGGGTGAIASAVIDSGSGQLIDVEMLSKGSGYISQPTVTISGGRAPGEGSDAVLSAVVNISPNNAHKLEDCKFYVLTDNFNVYKCLDNNNNAPSTIQPAGSQITPIVTSDGYVWKFMYNVPINLRNKFLSDDQIPVVSALTNQFYSGGALDAIIINNKGEDYTTASINVSGDGYLESDPTYLTSVVINSAGEGYVSPTITIGEPFNGASLWISSGGTYRDAIIHTTNGDFYRAISSGSFSATEPTHRFGTVINGTVGLEYIGTRARAEITVTSGEISAIDLVGSVKEVNVVDPGSGYTSAPSVNIIPASGDSGVGAVAICKMNNDSILYVTVTDSGDEYMETPSVVFGEEWTDGGTVLVGEQYFYSNRLYTVTVGGTLGSTAPTHVTGSETNGTATLTYAGTKATGVVVRRFGAGYSTAPAITIVDEDATVPAAASFLTTKSEAKILPVLQNGQLIGTTVVDGGIGYTDVTLTVTGDGTGAEVIADLNIGNIQSLQANNEILTTSGTINAIQIISGGYGYGVANVTINGDGTGATATATLDSASGRIVKINITNPGENYTFADVVIAGNGTAAKCRAVISPFGGHGKNSPDELFARTLMFYSNVSTDLNQGVAINNDYRQVGIIKNPRKFESDLRFNETIGSACYIIGATINPAQIIRDDNLTITRSVGGVSFERRYRVVSISSSYALVQSLDNDSPSINDTFTLVTSDPSPPSFTALSVGLPTVDKYSGQLMFIDNKAGFTPSADETVTLRTVLRF